MHLYIHVNMCLPLGAATGVAVAAPRGARAEDGVADVDASLEKGREGWMCLRWVGIYVLSESVGWLVCFP